MRQNNITIVINDPNRFFSEGLKNALSHELSERGVAANFTDSAFNTRGRVFFLAEETLSVANIHYLNRRMKMRPTDIFILQDAASQPDSPEKLKQRIQHSVALCRNWPVEKIMSVVNEQLVKQKPLRKTIPARAFNPEHMLTLRETEILRYLARGISNGGVARYLHISEKTVSAHKRNIMSKLNMIRPAELNYWLIHEGWCDPRGGVRRGGAPSQLNG